MLLQAQYLGSVCWYGFLFWLVAPGSIFLNRRVLVGPISPWERRRCLPMHHRDWIVGLSLWRHHEPSVLSSLPFLLLCCSDNACHRVRRPWTGGCDAWVLTCYYTFLLLGILRAESQATFFSAKCGRLGLIISEIPYKDNVFRFNIFWYSVSCSNFSSYQFLSCSAVSSSYNLE